MQEIKLWYRSGNEGPLNQILHELILTHRIDSVVVLRYIEIAGTIVPEHVSIICSKRK